MANLPADYQNSSIEKMIGKIKINSCSRHLYDIDIDLTSNNGIQGTECGFWNAECGIRKTEASSRIDGVQFHGPSRSKKSEGS
jgi:hypothetical protein